MTFIWNFWKKNRKASDPKQKNMNLDTTKSTEELAEERHHWSYMQLHSYRESHLGWPLDKERETVHPSA